MLLTESRDQLKKIESTGEGQPVAEDSAQRKRYLKSKRQGVDLPSISNKKRSNWVKSKKAMSKFFDELDYNNQINSSYDLTLRGRQDNCHNRDAA